MKNYTENYHLSALINQFPQNIHHTFTSKNKETFFKHQIDHAFFVNDLSNTITIERCNIMDNEVNTSDHNAVSFEFSFIKNLTKKTSQTSPKYDENVDFEKCEILEFYNKQIESIITKYDHEPQQANKQSQIDNMYNYITSTIIQAKKLTIEIQNNTKNKPKIFNPNNKKWFIPELKLIKNELMHLKYVQQQNNNFEIENQISKLKTTFRGIQRQNILLIEKKNLINSKI